jgi:hypothetical protein
LPIGRACVHRVRERLSLREEPGQRDAMREVMTAHVVNV